VIAEGGTHLASDNLPSFKAEQPSSESGSLAATHATSPDHQPQNALTRIIEQLGGPGQRKSSPCWQTLTECLGLPRGLGICLGITFAASISDMRYPRSSSRLPISCSSSGLQSLFINLD